MTLPCIVNIESYEEFHEVMLECENRGYRWVGGELPTGFCPSWTVFKEVGCVHITSGGQLTHSQSDLTRNPFYQSNAVFRGWDFITPEIFADDVSLEEVLGI